jgi:2-keto-4-pentenoate hydratase/2-oxohepta-3-ene-1,7-dioic acid hydratase in catechol pathway
MRLVSYDDGRVGYLADRQVISLPVRTMRDVIASWNAGGLPVSGHQEAIPLRDVRLRVPVADPSKIIAAPVNYRDHQAEMNVDTQVGALGFFLKAPSSLLDPGGTIQLPYHDRRFDQEGELALVIGRTARQVSEQDALSCVFGYTGLLDITMRGGEDRSARKSFDTFTPMGPVLVTADEFGDPGEVELRCWVSGKLRQKATTRDLGLGRGAAGVLRILGHDPLSGRCDRYRYPGWRRAAHGGRHHPPGAVWTRARPGGPGRCRRHDRVTDLRPQPRTSPAAGPGARTSAVTTHTEPAARLADGGGDGSQPGSWPRTGGNRAIFSRSPRSMWLRM